MEAETHSNGRGGNGVWLRSILLALSAAIFVWATAMPFRRAFLFAEFDYNEGWNFYNAQKVVLHQPLYPTTYAWTAVNYPSAVFSSGGLSGPLHS